MSQFGATDVGPHGREVVGRVGRQIGEKGHLASLDLFDDRDEQILFGSEVVQQHSMAGADCLGHLAQRSVADAAGRELVDERVE